MNTQHFASAATTFLALGASTLGYSGAVAATVTAGTIGYNVYSYFSQKANVSAKPATDSISDPMTLDNVIQPVIQPDIPDFDEELLPYTDEDLRRYPLDARRFMVLERAQKIRDIESKKLLLKGLIRLQNQAKLDEIEAQKHITRHSNVSRELASNRELVERGQIKIKEPSLPVINIDDNIPHDDIDNIHHDQNDDAVLERMKLELERIRENRADRSQLVKSSSVPNSIVGKRKESEPKTPSTNKDIEPPKKKSKSNSVDEDSQICSNCNFSEQRLWATDIDGKAYCYKCHTIDQNRCSYKPPTGGRACFRTNERELPLCSKHKHTTNVSEMDQS